MVEKGIVLGHKILNKGIEIDKAKIYIIEKLHYPTNVKGVRSFLGHAGFTYALSKTSQKSQNLYVNYLKKMHHLYSLMNVKLLLIG